METKNANVVVRPVKEDDLQTILEIASEVEPGFSSLPQDKGIIEGKIARSLSSFAHKKTPHAKFFFFVLECRETGDVVGTSVIESLVGHPWPFYNYKVSTTAHVCESLHLKKEHKVLYWVNDYQNTSELETLFLKPAYRGQKRGELISRARALFIAEYPDLVAKKLIASMHARVDKNGNSPFFEAIGRIFTNLTFKEADSYRIVKGKQFISDLMPQHPIYVDLLSPQAQSVIAQTSDWTKPAVHVLEKEGFRYRGYVDIFDAGPVLEVDTADLVTAKVSRNAIIGSCKSSLQDGLCMLLSNNSLDFRAVVGNVEIIDYNKVNIEVETAKALNLTVGDAIRICPFH
jgi:arginine N-succinyltransferase